MGWRKGHLGLMSWIFRGHQRRKSGRGDRQRERRNKVRAGELEVRPFDHGPGAVVGLLCVKSIGNRGGDMKRRGRTAVFADLRRVKVDA